MNGDQLHQVAIEIAFLLVSKANPLVQNATSLRKGVFISRGRNGHKNDYCDPYKSQEYQELYPFIIPGWIKNTGSLLIRIKT